MNTVYSLQLRGGIPTQLDNVTGLYIMQVCCGYLMFDFENIRRVKKWYYSAWKRMHSYNCDDDSHVIVVNKYNDILHNYRYDYICEIWKGLCLIALLNFPTAGVLVSF